MRIKEIFYTINFKNQFKLLPEEIKKKAVKTGALFRSNPFYPSLRLHKLKGRLAGAWSVSIDQKYRIIFKPLEDGDVLFASVGLHAIYND